MATEFLKLSPGKRRRLIHYVRNGIIETAGIGRDPDFSSASQVWIERMESALADTGFSQKTVDDLAVAYQAYLATLPEDERKALRLRLSEFIRVRDALQRGYLLDQVTS
jgi:hypothetical protein